LLNGRATSASVSVSATTATPGLTCYPRRPLCTVPPLRRLRRVTVSAKFGPERTTGKSHRGSPRIRLSRDGGVQTTVAARAPRAAPEYHWTCAFGNTAWPAPCSHQSSATRSPSRPACDFSGGPPWLTVTPGRFHTFVGFSPRLGARRVGVVNLVEPSEVWKRSRVTVSQGAPTRKVTRGVMAIASPIDL